MSKKATFAAKQPFKVALPPHPACSRSAPWLNRKPSLHVLCMQTTIFLVLAQLSRPTSRSPPLSVKSKGWTSQLLIPVTL
jgi:hypothetical protein